MKEQKLLDTLGLGFKITLLVLVLAPLIFCLYRLIETTLYDIINSGNPSYCGGTGLYLFASNFVLFEINIVLFIIAGIGLLISKKITSTTMKKNSLLTFRNLTFAPLVSQLIYMLLSFVMLCLIAIFSR